MRFSANVSMLFTDAPLLERFARARSAAFDAVELWWPAGEDPEAVARAVAAARLEVVVLNFDAGDMPSGDRGLLSDPAREGRFRANVPVALELAGRIGCRWLNALVGLELPGERREAQLERARKNVAWAADQAARGGAGVLIEMINRVENGPYLLRSTAEASDLVRSVGRENVRLQCDLYHMRRMDEDLIATLRAHIGEVGHVQIADVPGRGEPGTGEIPFGAVLGELERLGYRGRVGLEYRPSRGDTEASLAWLPLAARAADLPVGSLGITAGGSRG